MYRRVMANLKWNTQSQREDFKNAINVEVTFTYLEKSITHGLDMDKKPISVVDVRPNSALDADNLFVWIKNKMSTIPVLEGRVTMHDCKHDEGPPFEPCKIDKEFVV